jgi:hypothetical protein
VLEAEGPPDPSAPGLINGEHARRLRFGAVCAVGHDLPDESAASATERRTSPTADAIARRNRPVVRPLLTAHRSLR